ncbi:hypothetical protein ACS0TY_030318 [Phlomoides rotata]
MTDQGDVSTDFYCRRRARIHTSWTDENPGRRFATCMNSRKNGCSFWKWNDDPMCQRSKMIIPGLLRRINANEAEIKKLKKIQKKEKCRMVVLVVILCMILCWNAFHGKLKVGD